LTILKESKKSINFQISGKKVPKKNKLIFYVSKASSKNSLRKISHMISMTDTTATKKKRKKTVGKN
jgi:hypothetical protein